MVRVPPSQLRSTAEEGHKVFCDAPIPTSPLNVVPTAAIVFDGVCMLPGDVAPSSAGPMQVQVQGREHWANVLLSPHTRYRSQSPPRSFVTFSLTARFSEGGTTYRRCKRVAARSGSPSTGSRGL